MSPYPIDEPEVVRVMREYREGLGIMEASVLDDMGRRWMKIENRLAGDIQALEGVILRLVEEGKPITLQILWKMEAYQRLKFALEEETRGFNREFLVPMLTHKQVEFGMLGVTSAVEAIRASYSIQIAPNFPILNRGAIESMAGFLADGSPLSTLLKESYPRALEGLSEALINGVARGFGPGQIAKEMAVGMGGGLDRAMLIARTELNRSYRTASVMEYRASNVVDGFFRLVKKATACIACLMLDGEYLEKEEYLEDHPAGKCQAVPRVKGVNAPRWEKGREYFENLSPEEQMARMGPERYQLWRDGEISLSDLARKSHSPIWGDQPRVATVSELRGGF